MPAWNPVSQAFGFVSDKLDALTISRAQILENRAVWAVVTPAPLRAGSKFALFAATAAWAKRISSLCRCVPGNWAHIEASLGTDSDGVGHRKILQLSPNWA